MDKYDNRNTRCLTASRRHLIQTAGVGIGIGLAGCSGTQIPGSPFSKSKISRVFAKVPTPKEVSSQNGLTCSTLQVAVVLNGSVSDVGLSDLVSSSRGTVQDDEVAPFRWFRTQSESPTDALNIDQGTDSISNIKNIQRYPDPISADSDNIVRGHISGALQFSTRSGPRWGGGLTSVPKLTLRPGWEKVNNTETSQIKFSDGYVYQIRRQLGPGKNENYPKDGRYNIQPFQLQVHNLGSEYIKNNREALSSRNDETCAPTKNNATVNKPLRNITYSINGLIDNDPVQSSLPDQSVGESVLIPQFHHRPSPWLTTFAALMRAHARMVFNTIRIAKGINNSPRSPYRSEVWQRATDAVESTLFATVGLTPITSLDELGKKWRNSMIPVGLLAFYGATASGAVSRFSTIKGYYNGIAKATQDTQAFGNLVKKWFKSPVPLSKEINKEPRGDRQSRQPIADDVPSDGLASRDILFGNTTPQALYALVRFVGEVGVDMIGTAHNQGPPISMCRDLLTEIYYQSGAFKRAFVGGAADSPQNFQNWSNNKKVITLGKAYQDLQLTTRHLAGVLDQVEDSYDSDTSPYDGVCTRSETQRSGNQNSNSPQSNIDRFEDGNIAEYSGALNRFSVQSAQTYNQSGNALQAVTRGGNPVHVSRQGSSANPSKVQAAIRNDSPNKNNAKIRVSYWNKQFSHGPTYSGEAFNIIVHMNKNRIRVNGGRPYNRKEVMEATEGEWYLIELDNIDWDNHTIGTLRVNGNSIENSQVNGNQIAPINFANNVDSIDRVVIEANCASGSMTGYVDNVTYIP